MTDTEELTGTRVAVTGASGFIGGRVVERLVLSTGAEARAVVRGFGRAARLSTLPQDRLDFRTADLADSAALRQALEGCDVVVHCAFGSGGDVTERWAATVDGTANLLAAARAAGVRRVVHLSTVDVYASAEGPFDEQAPNRPADPTDHEYEQQKLAAEELALEANGPDLEVVVLQPGVVFGPWGDQWTGAQLRRPAADYAVLPSGADGGVCNAVYVDDVADAVLRACARPGVAGGRFLLAADETTTWGRFFDHFRTIRGLTPGSYDAAAADVPDWEAELYRATARVASDRAARQLGVPCATTLDEGMALVAAWAHWFGLGADSPVPDAGAAL
ncbi:NAD-dependent epimerase/dehydratase family protein [Streptomyces luteocolor]|uniref:Oxidoreductase n=1 Tax=Streptomyces luteocolor TaxID=285500 RepID=A0A125SZD6_9ACTN|nr:NAD-dependent epimerase/dehydratase family protein [Streptomyces luteocolor]BAU50940.1 oxidoreductase [Streptomyces luteocolor]